MLHILLAFLKSQLLAPLIFFIVHPFPISVICGGFFYFLPSTHLGFSLLFLFRPFEKETSVSDFGSFFFSNIFYFNGIIVKY